MPSKKALVALPAPLKNESNASLISIDLNKINPLLFLTRHKVASVLINNKLQLGSYSFFATIEFLTKMNFSKGQL